MKNYLTSLIEKAADPIRARNLVREYLQARILGAIQKAGGMIPLAFHGGTALHFLYQLGRFSEDLDFALEGDWDQYDFNTYLDQIERELLPEGYVIDFNVKSEKTVQSAFVRFQTLLFELGLSPHENEIMSIKMEVDTNPPQGAGLETTVIRRHKVLHLQHHDRASLLAGKIHAILQRPFQKGRDLYDLVWYLSDPAWPEPNLTLLNNALDQTGWEGDPLRTSTWRREVREKLDSVNWRAAREDVEPFLEPGTDPDILSKEVLRKVLEG